MYALRVSYYTHTQQTHISNGTLLINIQHIDFSILFISTTTTTIIPRIIISIDGDSDSLSEFRDISPMKSPMIDETATNMSYKVNGFAYSTTNAHGNQSSGNGRSNGVKKSHSKESNDSSHYDRKENSHYQTNGCTEQLSNGIHSSPLRSQLGLNLKSSTTPVKKPINPMTVSSFTFRVCV